MTKEQKRKVIFEAATDVFSQYGFRRTSMNDIAEAAGISRPALYLVFENKEDLFRHLANYRQSQAIDRAVEVLSEKAPISDRVVHAILEYERIFYEPISASPHGAEFMDINQSIASEDMMKGAKRLISHLAEHLDGAIANGEAALNQQESSTEFMALLMSSVNGQKKAATSVADFRKKVKSVASIFMVSATGNT